MPGYINSTYSKTGYWFSILSVILATLIMSLINIEVSAVQQIVRHGMMQMRTLRDCPS